MNSFWLASLVLIWRIFRPSEGAAAAQRSTHNATLTFDVDELRKLLKKSILKKTLSPQMVTWAIPNSYLNRAPEPGLYVQDNKGPFQHGLTFFQKIEEDSVFTRKITPGRRCYRMKSREKTLSSAITASSWHVFTREDAVFHDLQEEDICPPPPTVEFAKFFAKSYKVGTKVKYECLEGYKRKSGAPRFITCSSKQDGFAQWITAACIVDPTLRFPPKPEQPTTRTEDRSGSLGSPPTTLQPRMKGFCGVIQLPKHSKALWTNYTVGQQLQYQCMDGFQERPPISEMRTCQNSSGTVVWSKLSLRCTNDTTSVEEFITPETGLSNFSDSDSVGSSLLSYTTSFAAASAAFAIAMTSTVVIS